ncbi:MAG: 4-hydroxybenzoate octaprenyltransferase [Desulfovibrionaceae bacterium]
MVKKTDKKKEDISQNPPSNQEEYPLIPKENTPIAVREESAIIQKNNEPLMQREDKKPYVSFLDDSQTKDIPPIHDTRKNTSTSHNEEDISFSKMGQNDNNTSPRISWQEHAVSLLKQFFSLLTSFLLAIVPDIREIFSAKVFMSLCKMVRIEHTIFALPFAYTGFIIASQGNISFSAFFFLTLAMFGIRSFAMTLNRLIDLNYDKLNPRVASRELVTGDITIAQAKSFLFFSLVVFVVSTAFINTFLLMLSPLPIALSIIYSYTKRYTWTCHFVLGATLALAPIAGELAVVNTVSNGVALLAFGILFWVAGFDILYSCLDKEFDEKHHLYSVPVCFGIPTALLIAKFCHINTIIFFLFFGLFSGLGLLWYLVWVFIALALLWEHYILSEDDLSKMNQAFFTINACISIAVLIGTFLG